MITVYGYSGSVAWRAPWGATDPLPEGVVWIDLLEPTLEEERAVEAALSIDVPTREEMRGLELSSRFYQEGKTVYATCQLLANSEGIHPASEAVTFVLTPQHLVTLRYTQPRAFALFAGRVVKNSALCASSELAMIGLLEVITERMSDVLEKVAVELDDLSHALFSHSANGGGLSAAALEAMLGRLGRAGDLVSKWQEACNSVTRLFSFCEATVTGFAHEEVRTRHRTTLGDLRALAENSVNVNQKIAFLLDATLGLINIQQNNIIKLFSVVAVVFLPPTLIASIYGMNFTFMPELTQAWGYPAALALMVGSAVAPYWYFKRKRWF